MDPFQIRVIHKSYPPLHALEGSENQINQTAHMVAKAVILRGSVCTFHSGQVLSLGYERGGHILLTKASPSHT